MIVWGPTVDYWQLPTMMSFHQHSEFWPTAGVRLSTFEADCSVVQNDKYRICIHRAESELYYSTEACTKYIAHASLCTFVAKSQYNCTWEDCLRPKLSAIDWSTIYWQSWMSFQFGTFFSDCYWLGLVRAASRQSTALCRLTGSLVANDSSHLSNILKFFWEFYFASFSALPC